MVPESKMQHVITYWNHRAESTDFTTFNLESRMLTEQSSSGGMKAPMFRASKLTFLLKALAVQQPTLVL